MIQNAHTTTRWRIVATNWRRDQVIERGIESETVAHERAATLNAHPPSGVFYFVEADGTAQKEPE